MGTSNIRYFVPIPYSALTSVGQAVTGKAQNLPTSYYLDTLACLAAYHGITEDELYDIYYIYLEDDYDPDTGTLRKRPLVDIPDFDSDTIPDIEVPSWGKLIEQDQPSATEAAPEATRRMKKLWKN